jgi:putative acetyltransferase
VERSTTPRTAGLQVGPDDPEAGDVRALLATHLTFARSQTPPEDAHALELAELRDPSITFVSARRDGELVAVGALRELSANHGEIKSMHTSEAARGQGAGGAVLRYLVGLACERAYRHVSLETGAHPMFAPARALYAKAGFVPCGPFGDYRESSYSIYMTLALPRGR